MPIVSMFHTLSRNKILQVYQAFEQPAPPVLTFYHRGFHHNRTYDDLVTTGDRNELLVGSGLPLSRCTFAYPTPQQTQDPEILTDTLIFFADIEYQLHSAHSAPLPAALRVETEQF
jgi:hypothetical protein